MSTIRASSTSDNSVVEMAKWSNVEIIRDFGFTATSRPRHETYSAARALTGCAAVSRPHADYLGSGRGLIIGDFNSNTVWDSSHPGRNHSMLEAPS
jgi:hypothetical protein